jgi:DNA repair exonuclease SbcCD ATPase subunit
MSERERDNRQEELAAARKEGEIDALLREHSKHLAEINGSVGDAAKALAVLTEEVRDLSVTGERALRDVQHKLEDAIRDSVGEIRKLQEELRIRDERVQTARATLADETERRRAELAATVEQADRSADADQFRFTKWHGIALVALTALGVLLTVTHPWG